MKRVLVAMDGSEGADRAVEFAARLAIKYAATLLIINVTGGYGLPVELLRQFSTPDGAWLEELLTSMSAETLKAARDRAHKLGALTIVLESRGGNIAQSGVICWQQTLIHHRRAGERCAAPLWVVLSVVRQ